MYIAATTRSMIAIIRTNVSPSSTLYSTVSVAVVNHVSVAVTDVVSVTVSVLLSVDVTVLRDVVVSVTVSVTVAVVVVVEARCVQNIGSFAGAHTLVAGGSAGATGVVGNGSDFLVTAYDDGVLIAVNVQPSHIEKIASIARDGH